MRTIRVMFARTFGRLWPSPTTFLAVAGFLALSGGFFTVALMRKDLELAMSLAEGMTLPLGEAVLDYYRRAREFDSEDSTAVAKVRYPDRK